MTHSIRKIGALVMAVAMCFSLAVTASAAQAANTVKVYKDNNTSSISMANDAFMGGYTKTVSGENTIITLPLKVIHKLGLKGYITMDTVATVTNGDTTTNVGVAITGAGAKGAYNDGAANLVLTIPTNEFTAVSTPNGNAVKVDIHFGISLSAGRLHSGQTAMSPVADMYLYV